MENKLFSSTLAKKKELKTYLVLFWDNAEYLGLYLACTETVRYLVHGNYFDEKKVVLFCGVLKYYLLKSRRSE